MLLLQRTEKTLKTFKTLTKHHVLNQKVAHMNEENGIN